MKNKILSITLAVLMAASISACGNTANNIEVSAETNAPSETSALSIAETSESSESSDPRRLSIVVTNFPEYDFAHQIVQDNANVTMLLKPGAESHTYDPTPEDIITIQNSDMFVYVGGDSDEWVDDVLSSMDQSHMNIFRLMDAVETVPEELVEGMEEEAEEEESAEDGEEEVELDEHVWTSPVNAMTIVRKMSETLETLDPANKDAYEKNASDYISELSDLDKEFQDVVSSAKRKEIIVGDRFPFRYFCDEYALSYYAAFPGCSTDTQASAKTVAFLIDKVKSDEIPIVFHIELSNEEMCNSIAEATGAKSELLNAVHNVSDEDFKNGVTYVSLMKHNVEVLKEALN